MMEAVREIGSRWNSEITATKEEITAEYLAANRSYCYTILCK